MRGDLESRSITQVLDEAKRLADAGVKELLVVSQDTSGLCDGYTTQRRWGENGFLEWYAN